MRRVTLFLVSLLALPAMGLSQQGSRTDPVTDTVWLRGATWEAVPLVVLDSGKTKDTMAVREVGNAYLLSPGRVVYQGKLTDGGDWAIFSWVNGTTRRLAVQGKEFTSTDGLRKKIFPERFVFYGGPGWYAMPVAVERRVIIPNATYVTDGVDWQRLGRSDDTVDVGGVRMVLDRIMPRAVDRDGVLLDVTFKQPKTAGIVRWKNGRYERVLLTDDTLPGLGQFSTWGLHETFGLWSGLRAYTPGRTQSMALVRQHIGGRNYVDNVVVRSGATSRVFLRSDTLNVRNEGNGIAEAWLGPTGEVIAQRAKTIGVADGDGKWRELLGDAQIGHRSFELADVIWMDDTTRRAVIAVRPMQSTSSGSTYAVQPLLFYYDGTTARKLEQNWSPVFTNLRFGGGVGRPVHGYTRGIVGNLSSMAAVLGSWYFDPGTATLAAIPSFRTSRGDIGVDKLLGWNGEREAVVLHGGLTLLRRP